MNENHHSPHHRVKAELNRKGSLNSIDSDQIGPGMASAAIYKREPEKRWVTTLVNTPWEKQQRQSTGRLAV